MTTLSTSRPAPLSQPIAPVSERPQAAVSPAVTALLAAPHVDDVDPDRHLWGSRPRGFRPGRALEQWSALRNTLAMLGVEVITLPERPGLPDQMFAADSALVHGRSAVVGRFRQEERQGESELVASALGSAGYDVVRVPAEFEFEGAGQAAVCGVTLFGGWFTHRERLALTWVARQLSLRLVPLHLPTDTFDRLDTCFRPLRAGLALYVPEAFDRRGRALLEEHVAGLLAVPAAEAAKLACAAVVLGDDVILPAGCPHTADLVATHGFHIHTLELNEFAHLGSGPAGLVLPL